MYYFALNKIMFKASFRFILTFLNYFLSFFLFSADLPEEVIVITCRFYCFKRICPHALCLWYISPDKEEGVEFSKIVLGFLEPVQFKEKLRDWVKRRIPLNVTN